MIEINNLTKVYGNGYKALVNLNLVLPDKGFICITGESGCGKTTLLNCIYGNIDYDGNVKVNIKNDSKAEHSKHIAMVYQDFKLLDNFTVESNLKLAKESIGQKLTGEELLSVLQKVGLSEKYIKRKCKNLSGGEKQRVAIARAVVQNTSIILADEPTGSLDSRNAKAIFELFKQLSSEFLIVVVTHSERFAKEYGDYKITLEDGKIISNNLSQNKSITKDENIIEIKKNINQKSNNFSVKSILDMIILPYKNKGVLTVLTIFLIVFMLISCLLGSVVSMGNNYYLFINNAKIKQECIVRISNDSTMLSQTAKDLDCFDKVFLGFENKVFLSQNIEKQEDYFNNANFLKFNDDFESITFIECDRVIDVGGKLLAGRDVLEFNEMIINESLAYYFMCIGEYAGKTINNYNDLLGLEFGDFEIVGVLSACYDIYNGKYKNLTRGDFLQLSEDSQQEVIAVKSMLESNNNKTYVIKEGYSNFSKNSVTSLNPYVEGKNKELIENQAGIFDSINFSSKAQIKKNIKTYKDEFVDKNTRNKNNIIVVSSAFSNGIESITGFMDSFGVVVYILFAVFVAVIMLYCFTIVYILMKYAKKDIFILSDLGVTKNNLLKYKIISMLLIGISAVLITSILYALVVWGINVLMQNLTQIIFNLLFFNLSIFLCISALVLLMLILASTITNKSRKGL